MAFQAKHWTLQPEPKVEHLEVHDKVESSRLSHSQECGGQGRGAKGEVVYSLL